jgi:hypothetical protein
LKRPQRQAEPAFSDFQTVLIYDITFLANPAEIMPEKTKIQNRQGIEGRIRYAIRAKSIIQNSVSREYRGKEKIAS